jgi:hypothetical protein
MAIGWAAGPEGLQPIKGLYFDLFKAVLALFLMEMGLIVSRQLDELKRRGVALISFGLVMRLLSSCLGLVIGLLLGFPKGGMTMLATLVASASCIAVPAAMRIAVPEARPGHITRQFAGGSPSRPTFSRESRFITGWPFN